MAPELVQHQSNFQLLGDPHKVVPLKKITNKLRADLERMNNVIYEKMKRCRDIEKTAWKRLSNFEYITETIHMEIDNITAQLVRYSLRIIKLAGLL